MMSRSLALFLAAGACFAGAPAPRRTWELALFSWVKRQPAESGARNTHPVQVDPLSLGRALAGFRTATPKGEALMFTQDEAMELGRALTEALALAEPGEDLELVSTAKRDGFFGDLLSATARIFVQDGQLNLIFRDTRRNAVGTFSLDHQMPVFQIGSRAAASGATVRCPGAASPRADWVALPLEGLATPAEARPLPAPVKAAPVAPPAPPKAAPGVDERLRHLKRLREENLITEDEYTKRKAELLKEV